MPQRTLSETEFAKIRDGLLSSAPNGMDEASFQRWVKPRLAAAIGEAENLPAPPEGSAVGRFFSNAGAMVNPVSAAEGLYGAVRHPIDTASSILSASADQGQQAIDLAKQGRYTEAAGHALGAVPIIGPAAAKAGDQIAQGDIAGGLGTGAGLLAPFGAVKAVGAVRAALPARAATALEEGAASRVASVMRPTVGANKTRFGNMAETVAPDIAANPDLSAWSREGLHAKVQQGLSAAEDGLNAAADARLSARSFATQPIIDDLIAKRARLTSVSEEASSVTPKTTSRTSPILDARGQPITTDTTTAVPAGSDQVPAPNSARVAQLNQAIGELKGLGPTAKYESLRRIREAYDGPARAVYNPSVTTDFLKVQGEKLGAADITGTLRDALAKMDPQTASANAEYSLYKTANDVLDATAEVERTRPAVGRRMIARLTATTVGGQTAGAAGAVAGFVFGPALESALGSGFTTKIQTAQLMTRLAAAIRTGDEGSVATITSQLKRLAAQGVTVQGATSPSVSPMQPIGARQ